jgi:lipoprotein NlpI
LNQASSLFVSGQADAALALASQAIQLNTNHLRGWFMRARFYQETDQPAKAVSDFNEVLRIEPNHTNVWQQLGTEYFRLGDFNKSLECFNQFIEKLPQAGPSHWQRGIVAFEAGKLEDAFQQFEQYRRLDTNDVEVVVWQFLCVAKQRGLERARLSMPSVTSDPRVPMKDIHRLFAGSAEPAEVLRAAALDSSKPPAKPGEKLNEQMFYAHLYIGLHHEATGKLRQAADHLGQAAYIYRVKKPGGELNFMAELARVHLDALRQRMGGGSTAPSAGSR